MKFSKEELRSLIEKAYGMFTNEYEMQFLLKETGYSRAELEKLVPLVIETLGEKGSFISYHGERFAIEPYPVKKIVDPTGCGDAYRAGFLFTIARSPQMTKQSQDDIVKAGFQGSRLASYVLEITGTQG